jgi:hypothetical protein
MRIQNVDEIRGVLGDLAFPASKEQIVEHASGRTGRRSDEARALAALPIGDYANVTEVLRSVPAQPDPELSESERVYQHRHHKHADLAENMRETQLPPVEEELRRGRPDQEWPTSGS